MVDRPKVTGTAYTDTFYRNFTLPKLLNYKIISNFS